MLTTRFRGVLRPHVHLPLQQFAGVFYVLKLQPSLEIKHARWDDASVDDCHRDTSGDRHVFYELKVALASSAGIVGCHLLGVLGAV